MNTQATPRERIRPLDLLLPPICIVAATGLGYLFQMAGFSEINIVLVYLTAVLMTARFTFGFGCGLAASVMATFAFNYFFTDPIFTFAVNDTSYWITFAIMTTTAVATSTLTSRVKKSAHEASEREKEAQALYALTNRLTGAQSTEDIGRIAIKSISDMFGCQAAFLYFDDGGKPESTFLQHTRGGVVRRSLTATDRAVERLRFARGICRQSDEFCEWPVCGQEKLLGLLRIPRQSDAAMSDTQKRLLMAMCDAIAMAIDRFKSTQERIRYREETQRERYRSNLLRAISHDLRTPLSGIMGTSEMICGMSTPEDPRGKLAREIWSDADWLRSLVENILSLTRLEEGQLCIEKQPEAVEEIVGSALAHMEKRAPQYAIAVNVPPQLLIAPMDAKLIVQVLINLLDNAVKHTPPGGEISVSVEEAGGQAVFHIADRGEGIAPEDLPQIFQRFYTTARKATDAKRGIGLGLAICDAIVRAHGGDIRAQNRPGGGAEFIFSLPMEGNAGE